eukprot:CAMPEP_0119556704 /NCGR_PEP_ID=MMETSP1352-20130426/8577_1 /TAXON_ID=265584 /ORGANISM="Stauroneis constricta, Strain CCMP1120" /LENGTH=66 /DNA_ID=CAMNT_0007603693 /DNA_START=1022 /DNA_END=1219 /DNA_ORIENTATION=+
MKINTNAIALALVASPFVAGFASASASADVSASASADYTCSIHAHVAIEDGTDHVHQPKSEELDFA